ncbi:MAG: hypothetical protein LBH08_03760 [Puniceicoccales bacterium]|nr:hypothetical protein [Puniceicoccales bacterium]
MEEYESQTDVKNDLEQLEEIETRWIEVGKVYQLPTVKMTWKRVELKCIAQAGQYSGYDKVYM